MWPAYSPPWRSLLPALAASDPPGSIKIKIIQPYTGKLSRPALDAYPSERLLEQYSLNTRTRAQNTRKLDALPPTSNDKEAQDHGTHA